MKQSQTITVRLGLFGLMALLSVFAMGLASAAGVPAMQESVVVFPFAVGTGIGGSSADSVQQHADDLLLVVSEGLTQTNHYQVLQYDRRNPAVRRAVHEQLFTEKQVSEEPFDTDSSGVEKALGIAKLMGAEYAVVGSIDGYSFDTAKGQAELTVTAIMLDVDSGDEVSRAVTTGRAGKVEGQSDQTENAIAVAATYDAAEKVLNDLTSASVTETTDDTVVVQSSKSSSKKGFIPAMLGALLLGFLISGG